jgi:hypothetical protein
MEELIEIQKKLKVPKNRYNRFGKFKYRSCEDILEAVKPLLKEGVLTLSDSIVEISGNFYIKGSAYFSVGGKTVKATAYAREPESKKGMDASQVTCSASSYARKYALDGLFLIDDSIDADSLPPENIEKNELTPENKKLWDRALESYRTTGGFDAIEKAMTISTKNKAKIKKQVEEAAGKHRQERGVRSHDMD